MLPGVQKESLDLIIIYTLQIGDVLTCKRLEAMCFHTNVKYNKILGDTAVQVKCSPTRTIKLFLAEKHFILLQFFNLN